MTSTMRFDKWENTLGQTVAESNSAGSMIIAKMVPPVINRYNLTLRSGITLSAVTGLSFTDSLSSYITSKTFAVTLSVGYKHNGSTNHGYWSGYFVQSGKNSQEIKRGNWEQAHFDWYFNIDETEITVPWDATGSTSLETYTTNAFNTSSENTYSVRLKAVWANG
jgi:hypothetical protein